MQSFIFAAGIGSRLRPLTDTKPKALVPLAGRPLFDHVVDTLTRQGIDRFVVNVHHFAPMLIDYITHRPDAHRFLISDESDLLRDTGGAIRHAAPLLGDRPFLIHNVDIISDFDLSRMTAHIRPHALATLLVSRRDTQRYLLFDDDMRLVGWTNTATGEIKTPYPDLDLAACHHLAFAGIHYLSPEVHALMITYPDRFSIIDFYLHHAATHPIYGYIQPDLHLIDVGKPSTLALAQTLLPTP